MTVREYGQVTQMRTEGEMSAGRLAGLGDIG
jgi:hypothetical protein